MPFDDFVDLNADLTISDLEKLDNLAQKAEKRLENLKKRGGIFSTSTSNITSGNKAPVDFVGTLPLGKQDKRIEKTIQRLTKKVEEDVVKNLGKDREGTLSKILGDDVGRTLFSIGKNPVGFFTNAIIGATGAGFAVQIAQFVINEIQRVDTFFKAFVDRIDNRTNQLKNKEIQARIAAGLTQEILTTESGNVSARDAYNTFNEFNSNRSKLEDDFAIRNTSGYE
ncbi:MAG: hypothetical protein KC444_09255 [Nitrosopumilus sp.]|nr:hypothetical protein [Nitrosopumilus sp.]